MKKLSKFIIKTTMPVLFMLLLPILLYAACPPSYQSIEELKVTLISARWVEEGTEFALCTNLSNPHLNDLYNSYGYDYGPADYRCGDIYLADVYLANAQRMFLQPSDKSLSPVEFTPNSSFNFNQDSKTRSWCEEGGVDLQTCYSERKLNSRYITRLDRQALETIYESLSRREKKLWDREGASAVLRNLETQYTVRDISTCKKISF